MRATSPVRVILLDLITLIFFSHVSARGVEWSGASRRLLLCKFDLLTTPNNIVVHKLYLHIYVHYLCKHLSLGLLYL